MKFIETELQGAFIIEPERLEDIRGFFARVWCMDEFIQHGLNPNIVQSNISYNKKKGTLRGMHYQRPPYEEDKVVRCTMGEIYDVIVDLREDSPTYSRHIGIELSQDNRRMLYIPRGFAHGFQSMTDDTEVHYLMSETYVPEAAAGIKWDSPVLSINWPQVENRVISERDNQWPNSAS